MWRCATQKTMSQETVKQVRILKDTPINRAFFKLYDLCQRGKLKVPSVLQTGGDMAEFPMLSGEQWMGSVIAAQLEHEAK